MISMDFFDKNKNKIINSGVILLAIFAAVYLFNLQSQQFVSLEANKEEEVKKNEVLESLSRVEKRINSYKHTLNKKDLGGVIGAMTDIARETGVKVISVKPGTDQPYADYIKTSFLIVIKVPDYHALGKFISKVENYKDLFLVEDVNITLTGISQIDNKSEKDLDISLKLSTITCL